MSKLFLGGTGSGSKELQSMEALKPQQRLKAGGPKQWEQTAYRNRFAIS